MTCCPLSASSIDPDRASGGFCLVDDAITVLQGKWTLQIVHALIEGPMGFNELARAIGGCNPSTLAQRLDTLVRLDVLARRVEASTPPRTLDSLTAAGDALRPVVAAIEQWGQLHLRKARVRAVRRAALSARASRVS